MQVRRYLSPSGVDKYGPVTSTDVTVRGFASELYQVQIFGLVGARHCQ